MRAPSATERTSTVKIRMTGSREDVAHLASLLCKMINMTNVL